MEIRSQDGLALHAWWLPAEQAGGDAVMVFHGVTDNRQSGVGTAHFLHTHGYSVLLPDSRAHGESGGDLATYGLREADDVRRWMDWLEAVQKPRCVYGYGASMGAGILLQSLTVEQRFCAVAAESPFADLRNAIFDRLGLFFGTGPWLGRYLVRPSIEAGVLYAYARYGLDLGRVSPQRAVAGSRTPVLLIHGLLDMNLRVENSRLIHAANPATTVLWEVPGADHYGVYRTAPREWEETLIKWFRRTR